MARTDRPSGAKLDPYELSPHPAQAAWAKWTVPATCAYLKLPPCF